MPHEPHSPASAAARAARVREIIDQCVSLRGKGQPVTDEELLAANPDLANDLRPELRKLALFARARQQAAERPGDNPPDTVTRAAQPDNETRSTAASVTAVETSLSGGSSVTRDFVGLDALPGYEILTELARGGQGVVYKALQKSTKREVAVKVLREGPSADPHDKARFDREVEILGQLKHPHIVTIHDSGAVAGHFYYVMDYISGKSLDQWIADFGIWMLDSKTPEARSQSKIPTPKSKMRETLALFAEICEAVNVAHLRGIIHRDLKPGNIRVDPAGRPHILDFGLAKLSEHDTLRDSQADSMTQIGQFVGSLPWSAPEQAERQPHKIDLRTDVYALGVIGYQMLTGGEFPYPVKGNLADVLDHIRHTEPAPPSRRGSVSAPRWRIDDEVETIVLKCLQKEQGRRYQTAGELARDVRHYLNHEPIEAKRDSALYVLKKTLRRHWVAASVVGGFFVLVGAAAIALAILYQQQVVARAAETRQRERAEAALRQEEAQRKLAEKRQQETARTADFMAETFQGVKRSVALNRDTQMLKEMMDGAGERIKKGELRDSSEAELRLRLTIGNVYREIAEYPAAEEMLRPALELSHALYGTEHEQVAEALFRLGLLLLDRGSAQDALEKHEEALAIWQRLFPGDHPNVAADLNGVALCLQSLGRFNEALLKLEESLAMKQRLFPGDHPDVATGLTNVAACLDSLGRSAAALPKYEAALAMFQRLFPGDHPNVAESLNGMAVCLDSLGQSAEALPKHEAAVAMKQRLFPGDHPDVANSLGNLAKCLDSLGRSAEALPKYEAAVAILQRLFPGDHPDVAQGLHNVAYCLESLGRSAEALSKNEAALAMLQHLFPGDHPKVATSLNNVAYCLDSLGRSAEALPQYEAALAMYQRLFPGDHPKVAVGLNNVAACLDSLGRSAEALPKHEEALAMRQRLFPGDHPDVAANLNNVAYCLDSLGRSAAALSKHEEALAMAQRLFPGDHPDVMRSLNNVAYCLKSLGRPAEALPKFEEALAMGQRLFPGDHPHVAGSLNNVAVCLNSLGRSTEALPKFEEALAMWQRILPPDHVNILHPQISLGNTLAKLGRFAEAEPPLLDAVAWCERSTAHRRAHWRSVLNVLVELYDAWHAAEPDKGYDAKAAEWRTKLEEWQASTQPASAPVTP